MKKTTTTPTKTVKETRPAYRTGTRKTAPAVDLAIPAPIVEAARRTAQQLGMPLGEFYAAALTAYVATYQGESITAQLNRVYGAESSALDPVLVRIQTISIAAGSRPSLCW